MEAEGNGEVPNEWAFAPEELKELEFLPITFDEDCPETTPERAMKFRRVNPVKRTTIKDLTHTVTHTAKRPDGTNGRETVKDHAPPQ